MKVIFWSLLSFVVFVSVETMAVNTVFSDQISQFGKQYPQSAPFNHFVAKYKNEMPTVVAEFLAIKFQKVQSLEMPKVKIIDASSLEIQIKGEILNLTFLPEYKIKLNGKILDLLAAGDLESQWSLIMKALPVHEQASRLELLINKAHAENQEGLNGGLMMGTGAMGAVGGGATMLLEGMTAAAMGATGAGAVVMVASYFIWNNGVCVDMGKERFTCLKQKDELEERIAKRPEILALMKAHQPVRCGKEVDQKSYKEIADTLTELVSANNELFRAIVTCRKTKNELAKCLADSSLDAYYLCVKTYGVTNKYLPAYAGGNIKAAYVPRGTPSSARGFR